MLHALDFNNCLSFSTDHFIAEFLQPSAQHDHTKEAGSCEQVRR